MFIIEGLFWKELVLKMVVTVGLKTMHQWTISNEYLTIILRDCTEY